MSTSQSGESLPRVNTSFLPILLRGHEGPLTSIKYNQDGDLLFTTSKDHKACVYYSETGERLGTYSPHRGAVWDIDASWDSQYVLTACGDSCARLFVTTTGEYLVRMPHQGVVRTCAWGESNRQFATASDPFHTRDLGCINIFDFPTPDQCEPAPSDSQDRAPIFLPRSVIHVDDMDKAVCMGWTIADKFIIAGFDKGLVIKYDVETCQEVARSRIHGTDRVNRLTFNREKTMFITASKDCTAKLVDPNNLEVIKEYRTAEPVNGACISPTLPHVLLGGGQDAQGVTTSGGSGKFETKFFHMIYGEEFGRVKGHFGPVNALAVHPYGKSFASGSEDGFARLHKFDSAYLNTPDLIPSDLKKDKSGSTWM